MNFIRIGYLLGAQDAPALPIAVAPTLTATGGAHLGPCRGQKSTPHGHAFSSLGAPVGESLFATSQLV